MISVENRVPNPGQEGRVLITPESGSPFYATLAMADGATQAGTPWSRNTGNLLQADIRSYPIAYGQTVTAGQVVDVVGAVPTVDQYVPGAIQMQNIPVGSFITRTENGVPQYYLVVHQGLPSEMYDASCNGTWVLRKDIYENAAWDVGNSNVLPGADIFTTMAGMLSLFDEETRAAIKTVKIPYCVGGGSSTVKSGADGLECQIFPLGVYELGWTTYNNASFPADGQILSYFKGMEAVDARREAVFNGSVSPWMTRSPKTGYSSTAWSVIKGGYDVYSTSDSYGIRPTFILDPSLEVEGYYTRHDGQIATSGTPSQAIALQGGSAGDTIPVIFQGVAQLSGVTQGQEITSPGVQGFGAMDGWLSVFPYWMPGAKVATGGYVGTGSYGSGTPNSVMLPFKPALFFVTSFEGSVYTPNLAFALTLTSSYQRYMCVQFQGEQSNANRIFCKLNQNELTWYSAGDSSSQLNNTGITYYWIAISY